jgi:hypothetical protein
MMIRVQKYREPIKMENWLVNADEIGTLSGDWLILDNGPSDFDAVMTTVIHLDSVEYFTSTKPISNNRIFLLDRTHPDGYLYWVTQEEEKPND